jgi:hypothetical protein
MKSGRLTGRGRRGRDVMDLLTRARPAVLDADVAQRSAWPRAGHIVEAADRAADDVGSQRHPSASATAGPLARPGSRKLLAAVASAIATGAVAAVVLAVASGVLPFGGTTTPRSPRVTASSGGGAIRIALHDLRLHGHWRGRLEYGVGNGVVYLAGTAGTSNGVHVSMATLPPGVRPARQLDLTVNLGGTGMGVIQVTPDGQISVFAAGNGNHLSFVSLDGVSFPLGS